MVYTALGESFVSDVVNILDIQLLDFDNQVTNYQQQVLTTKISISKFLPLMFLSIQYHTV